MKFNKSNFFRNLIIIVVMLGISVWFASSQGVFRTESLQEKYMIWCNAFFIPGILLFCLGLLVVASNGGTFDMIGYGVRLLFSVLLKNPKERKYADFYEYRKAKQQNQRSFWYMVVIGGAFLVVAIIFCILFNQQYSASI